VRRRSGAVQLGHFHVYSGGSSSDSGGGGGGGGDE
jgi:hypothetical protein